MSGCSPIHVDAHELSDTPVIATSSSPLLHGRADHEAHNEAMTDLGFDPFTAAALADPYPDFARFVERQPVFWSNEINAWVVSRHHDAKQVLRRYEVFSASNALSPITPPCPAAGRALSEGGFRSIP